MLQNVLALQIPIPYPIQLFLEKVAVVNPQIGRLHNPYKSAPIKTDTLRNQICRYHLTFRGENTNKNFICETKVSAKIMLYVDIDGKQSPVNNLFNKLFLFQLNSFAKCKINVVEFNRVLSAAVIAFQTMRARTFKPQKGRALSSVNALTHIVRVGLNILKHA